MVFATSKDWKKTNWTARNTADIRKYRVQTVLGDGKIVEKRRKNNGFRYVERFEKNELVWNENQSKQDEIKNKNVEKCELGSCTI